MRISILQTDIVWENKQENLRRLREKLETLRGTTEIVVLPETFSTGFSMDTASLAEPTTGETIATLRQWSEEYRLALAGSYIACETASEGRKPSYYNRAFFLTPEGNTYYYDKRHLFRMGHETEHFTSGNRRTIILLIYVANWPIPRRKVWDILLQARALENISYVCGVNRIGKDGRDIPHSGGSVVYSPKGEVLATVPDNEEAIATASLNLSSLQEFRLKFPAWKDADEFVISSNNSSQ